MSRSSRSLGAALLSLTTLGVGASACGKSTTTPGVMLAFSSDMSVPKDITAVGLYIRTKSGTVLYNNVVEATVSATGDRSVRLPASFAVLSNGSPATVKVQLIAYGTKRKPFVIRQATTSVPVNRLSVLRMPLLWLNQHSADTANGVVVPTNANTSGQLNVASLLSGQVADDFALPEGGFKLPCANDDESFIGGKCVTVDPNAQLPDFDPTEDPNSPDGACFSVEACFSKAASVRERIQKDGKIDLTGFDLSSINLALVTKDGAGIALGDGRFAISLDSGSELEGFFVKNGALYLSSAVMHALDSGLATDIVATTSCAQKTLDVGNCGPWNPAKTPLSSNRSDGGIPSLDAAPRTDGATADADASTLDASDAGSLDGSTDGATDASADVDAGPPIVRQGGGEVGLMGLSVTSPDIFVQRKSGQGRELLKIQKGGAQTNVLQPLNGYGETVYTTYLDFSAAGGFWGGMKGPCTVSLNGNGDFFDATGAGTPHSLFTSGGGFFPVGCFSSGSQPVAVGQQGGSPTSFFFAAGNTVWPFYGLSGGELPMSVLRSDATHYLLGTNQSNVRTCFLDAGQTRIDCTQLNGTLPSNVIPVSFAADGTRAFVVGARQTGQEMDGEGIYKVDSASVTAAYTRALDPNLHFDALGGGPTRQGVALSSTYGYFTTTTRLYAFPVLGGSANVVVDKLNHATEVQTDESFVYFIEYADGVQPGGLYRMPLK